MMNDDLDVEAHHGDEHQGDDNQAEFIKRIEKSRDIKLSNISNVVQPWTTNAVTSYYVV